MVAAVDSLIVFVVSALVGGSASTPARACSRTPRGTTTRCGRRSSARSRGWSPPRCSAGSRCWGRW
ncbi:hypothetical protein ACFQRB_07725 [Halobaculum litoreum]|uniref:Uncharacterized protein n=1 Tax=Halobaculum litoreum TaxID=3031998 RepID=A0ABD5XWS4_9EURY